MPQTLIQAQWDEFSQRGVLRFDQFFPAHAIELMRDRLWADLERRYQAQRDRPGSWSVPMPAQFQALRRSGAFEPLATPGLMTLADAMLGVGEWDKPQHWGVPLVTFPTLHPVLARPPWHLDLGFQERLSPLSTLRVFTFLEPALPGGGGTLYVAGSHKFALEQEQGAPRALRSAEIKHGLREHEWFANLLDARTTEVSSLIKTEVVVGRHAVSVEEMTGSPGDLILMHPGILHAIGHNHLARPRLMLTETIRRRVLN